MYSIKRGSLISDVQDWEMKSKSGAIRKKAEGKKIIKLQNELSLHDGLGQSLIINRFLRKELLGSP